MAYLYQNYAYAMDRLKAAVKIAIVYLKQGTSPDVIVTALEQALKDISGDIAKNQKKENDNGR